MKYEVHKRKFDYHDFAYHIFISEVNTERIFEEQCIFQRV